MSEKCQNYPLRLMHLLRIFYDSRDGINSLPIYTV